jgi:hypothetical protein
MVMETIVFDVEAVWISFQRSLRPFVGDSVAERVF